MPFSTIVDDLAARGWSLQSSFLPSDVTHKLADECRRRHAEGTLAPASVGRGEEQAVREGIRGDHIHWLEAGQAEVCDAYLALMDELRRTLNRELFLGLEEFECHFAFYPPGAFYQTHLDRFRDDDSRCVSAVLYLNPDWQPADGGELRMHFADGSNLDVPPLSGDLLVFLSGDFPHEVLVTRTERLSLTGWFRRRPADVLAL
ncbi:2OG-Fe(II) oxygenase [Stutzerimonas zhaodongensis]|uniref:2OG-Fe(II) oxygenase n=1 Tax=Stutzerimonas zhaodongensis TaxID=1176257 RepID=A0A3M2HZI4_9GAMM|nr:2OG-Fe(II) oxygenase [Stutzerimonas zhaodongensis]MCQ4317623.1 2OG-Fe(II) oxygenase [Stutzerimonas zhaodongensis]RMH91284.1 2OG-Fe(II) oxygenase [Stutzerimonas zhaodongensis]